MYQDLVFAIHYLSIHQRYLIITLETFHYAWRCFVVVSYLCIDIDSLIMRPRLIFLVVVENYQEYLIHDGIPLANWPLSQMNGGYISFIKCDMSFITIQGARMMGVSWKPLLCTLVTSVSYSNYIERKWSPF